MCITHNVYYTHTQIHPLVIQPLGIIMIFIFINFTYYSEFLKRERRNKNLLNNSLLILYNIIQFSRTVRHPYTPNNLIVCLTTLGTYLVFFSAYSYTILSSSSSSAFFFVVECVLRNLHNNFIDLSIPAGSLLLTDFYLSAYFSLFWSLLFTLLYRLNFYFLFFSLPNHLFIFC